MFPNRTILVRHGRSAANGDSPLHDQFHRFEMAYGYLKTTVSSQNLIFTVGCGMIDGCGCHRT